MSTEQFVDTFNLGAGICVPGLDPIMNHIRPELLLMIYSTSLQRVMVRIIQRETLR
jgi:hypothetical protein